MPNTFSMAPRYVRDFAARTGFASPERDLFALLAAKLHRLARDGRPAAPGIALLGDARDAGARARTALRDRSLPDRARLVLTSPPYLRVLKYGYYNWLRTWLLGFSAAEIDATLDDAHRREPYVTFLREVLAGLRPILADDAVVALVLGDVEVERGRAAADGLAIGLADEAWEGAARLEGYLLAGVVRDEIAALPQDDEAVGLRGGTGNEGRSHPGRRSVGARPAAGARRRLGPGRLELAGQALITARGRVPEARPSTRPGRRRREPHRRRPTDRRRREPHRSRPTAPTPPRPARGRLPPLHSESMNQMYHPDDLAAMDPLVLMKNLDHVRMTSRRLSYILQQQVHLYTPEANQLREKIDTYVEAERQIEGEMARRQIRA